MLPIFETKVLIYHSKVTLDFNFDLDLKLERYIPLEIYTGWVKKKFRRLEGCGIKKMLPIFETKVLIYHSKVTLDFNLDLDLKLERYNPLEIYTGWVKKKFRRLEGCGIKKMLPIFETKVLIYHSKATLDFNLDLDLKLERYNPLEIYTGWVKKKFRRLEGCGIKKMLPIFETKVLIYHSKVTLDFNLDLDLKLERYNPLEIYTGWVKKKFRRLEGCGIKKMLPIFETKVLIYHSKVTLDFNLDLDLKLERYNPLEIYTGWVKKKFRRLEGCGIKKMLPIFETKVLIYHSKVTLDFNLDLDLKLERYNPLEIYTGWVKKKFRRLEGCGIKKMLPIFETKVLIYHSKATLDFNLDLDLKLERYNPLEIYTGWVKKKLGVWRAVE